MQIELTEQEVKDVMAALQQQADQEIRQGYRKLGDDLRLLALKIKRQTK